MRIARRLVAPAVSLLVLSSALLGCEVDKHTDGNGENVKIATPFGGLSVKTDDAAVQQSIGLATYPGATPVKKEKGHDDAADLNFSLGSFHVGVKALSFTTPDAPDKVLAFYRKDLGRFGVVIECRGHEPVGTPTRTPEGLTCESDDSNQAKVRINDDDYNEELKAGSKHHQHIVALEGKGSGTKFGLVVLDLPDKLDLKSGSDHNESQ